MSLEPEEVTGPIIGAAIEVHRSSGPGFIEAVYEEALAVELRERAIPFERQVAVSVSYRGHVGGLYRLDLFVGGQIVVELKAVNELIDTHRSRTFLPARSRPFPRTHPELRQDRAGGEACRLTGRALSRFLAYPRFLGSWWIAGSFGHHTRRRLMRPTSRLMRPGHRPRRRVEGSVGRRASGHPYWDADGSW